MRVTNHLVFLVCVLSVTPFFAWRDVHAERIVEREFQYRATLPALTFAQKAETVSNPLHFPQLKWIIPDGVYVEKDDVITRFDRAALLLRLDNLHRDRAIVQAELKQSLTSIRNRDMALADELQELRDRLVVFETLLERYRGLPEPDDVAIARGRLHVARLEHEAAERDLERAKDRFKRGMISPGEFDDYEQTYREKEARLGNREGQLELASRPAEKRVLHATELQIQNLKLEIDKLLDETHRNAEISKIEREGVNARVEIMEGRITETEEDLNNAIVRAPVSGHVVYQPMFRRYLGQTSNKMFKDFAYLTIPDPQSVALKGVLPESEQRFFKVGDEVTIRVTGRPREPLKGRIESFSALARDRAEQEQERWIRKADSGIMVFDVVIQPLTRPTWLHVGLSAECELEAGTPVRAPSIPALYVKSQGGEHYVSFDGVFQRVEGTLIDGYYVLNDESLLNREVDRVGRMETDAEREANGDGHGAFRTSGELHPSDTEDVIIGDVYRWQKVAWLIPEDTMAKEGDVVARLDEADTKEKVKEAETELRQATSRREKEEEELELRTRENRFDLERAKNLCAIAKMKLEELLDDRETEAKLKARLDVALAQIRVDYLERELDRLEKTSVTALSPLEIARLKRDHTRACLQQEAAGVRLQKLVDGPEESAICRAELDYEECRATVSNLSKKLDTDQSRNTYALQRAQREERRLAEELAERRLEFDNLVLRAPKAGLVRYGKVRNSGVWSKVAVGSQVTDRAVIVRIADVSRMYVRVELPERLYTSVRVGLPVKLKLRSLDEMTLGGEVSDIEFLFRPRRPKDTQRGLYSSHEELGETVFFARVEVDAHEGGGLKPGAMAEVSFPFDEKGHPLGGGK